MFTAFIFYNLQFSLSLSLPSDYIDNSDPESEESGFSQRRRSAAVRKSTRLAVAFDPGTLGLPSGEEGGGKVRKEEEGTCLCFVS